MSPVNSIFSVSPTQLVPLIDHLTARQNSKGVPKPMVAPFIWGAPGIGKTALVNAIATMRGSRIVALHLPQFDPTDLKGIPIRNDDGSVSWVPSSYLPQSKSYTTNAISAPVTVDWACAIGIAVYAFDEDGTEIACFNDPMLPDTAGFDVTVVHVSLTEWNVAVRKMPEGTHSIELVDKAIVFLDELSAAEPSTQNAALQLVLDRRVGEYEIPTGIPVIAAGNREDDGGFVQTLSHPLCNRFVHLTLVPSAEDFIDWGLHAGLKPEILGYVKAYPDAVMNYDPDSLVNGNYGFSTPRSLTFLSDQYESAEFFEAAAGNASNPKTAGETMRLVLYSGIIGQEEASRFVAYLEIMYDLPSIDEILAGTAGSIEQVERSQTFGLLYSLMQNLKYYYDKYYDAALSRDDQPVEWTGARDAILDFITDNYEKESGTWAGTMMFQKMGITAKALRSEAGLRFTSKYVDIMTNMGRVRKAA